MTKTAIIIPARLNSTRLDAKLLKKANGKTIIQYVYEACKKSKLAHSVIIATDSELIYNVAKEFNADVERTLDTHKSGSDRICEVASRHDFDYIINVQGDEPQITPEVIDLAISTLINSDADVSTLVREIDNEEQINNPNCVKCVFDNDFNALYFSRCPIPYNRDGENAKYYAHIGLYGYKKESLIKMTQCPQSDLEKIECLEQLRALQNGMNIKVALTNLNPIGIDTQSDLEKFINSLT